MDRWSQGSRPKALVTTHRADHGLKWEEATKGSWAYSTQGGDDAA